MKTRIYTVHEKGSDRVEVVADGFSLFALLLPQIWALWHGLWITFLGQIGLLAGAAFWSPLAVLPVSSGIALILALEGAAVQRAELSLRGWRQAGIVRAGSPEGAEEKFLKGEAL